jgi:hypothetical protein
VNEVLGPGWHRLSRAGNRRINRVLRIMALVQLRKDTPGRAHYRRKVRHEALGDRVEVRDLRRRAVAAVW